MKRKKSASNKKKTRGLELVEYPKQNDMNKMIPKKNLDEPVHHAKSILEE